MFRDRQEAGQRLADELRHRPMINPLVLTIPRGGVVVGAELARALGAELDVVLARKLRAPDNPEFALGALGEDGAVYLNPRAEELLTNAPDYLEQEQRRQQAEITRRSRLIRSIRPRASMAGRTVIVTDDGIATGATMAAALHVVRGQRPRELIVAVPVAARDRLEAIRPLCDVVVCPLIPQNFWAVGQHYFEFEAVEDDEVMRLLRESMRTTPARQNV